MNDNDITEELYEQYEVLRQIGERKQAQIEKLLEDYRSGLVTPAEMRRAVKQSRATLTNLLTSISIVDPELGQKIAEKVERL